VAGSGSSSSGEKLISSSQSATLSPRMERSIHPRSGTDHRNCDGTSCIHGLPSLGESQCRTLCSRICLRPYLDVIAGAAKIMLDFSLNELLRLRITAFEFLRRMYCHSGCEADLESGHVLPSLAFPGNSSGCRSVYHTTDYMPIKLAQVIWTAPCQEHERVHLWGWLRKYHLFALIQKSVSRSSRNPVPATASAPSPPWEDSQGNEGK
jgi:hypothetical protein